MEIAWVLMIYTGLHQGHIVIPGIKSQQACIELYRQMEALPSAGAISIWRAQRSTDVHCLPYEIAK